MQLPAIPISGERNAKEREMSELQLKTPGGRIPSFYPLVLRVECDPKRCSPNVLDGKDWRVIQRAREAMRLRCEIAYRDAGEPEWEVPVEVDVLVRRGTAMDEDNLRAAMKAGCDSLFKRKLQVLAPGSRETGKREYIWIPRKAITLDDNRKWVRWGVLEQQIGSQWKGTEEFVLTIWPTPVLEARERALDAILLAAVRAVACRDGFALAELEQAVLEARRLGWVPKGG